MGERPRHRIETTSSSASIDGGLEGRGSGSGSSPGSATTAGRHWPVWGKVLASFVILFHLSAVVAGALGVPPASELEQSFAEFFSGYFELMDQGYAYRYYAEPPPTPVITATLEFGDSKPVQTVRLPGREVSGPRMRHQRQLALANTLFADFQEARRESGNGELSRWGRAYAKHLCRTNPGCLKVTLHAQQHLIPDIQQVRENLYSRRPKPFDLFDESLFTIPERIGDYPCDGF